MTLRIDSIPPASRRECRISGAIKWMDESNVCGLNLVKIMVERTYLTTDKGYLIVDLKEHLICAKLYLSCHYILKNKRVLNIHINKDGRHGQWWCAVCSIAWIVLYLALFDCPLAHKASVSTV